MGADYCLILSAGLGTRMGEIGKKLPKILWPIFEKTLLELQIEFAKQLGVKKIFLNTHYLAQDVEKFIKEKNIDINILFEKELLDVGGAIHNLAKMVHYHGNLLILNGDQFYFFDNAQDMLFEQENEAVTLIGKPFIKKDGYNALEANQNGLITSRVFNKDLVDNKTYYTYTGVALVNLDILPPIGGKSDFFESVANYRYGHVKLVIPQNYQYFDFGTSNLYFSNIFLLLDAAIKNEKNNKMLKFLFENNAFNKKKVQKSVFSYSIVNTEEKNIINLTSNEQCTWNRKSEENLRAIVIKSSTPLVMEKSGIYFDQWINYFD